MTSVGSRFGLLALACLVGCGPDAHAGRAPDRASEPVSPPVAAPCSSTRAPDDAALCAAWNAAHPGPEPVDCALDAATHILTASHEGEPRADRYLVLPEGGELVVVGELSELLLGERTDDWVGVRSQDLTDLDGDGHEELRVIAGVHRRGPEGECLSADEEHLWLLICGARCDGYACAREELSYTRTVEISGGANPMSSQYDYAMAEGCHARIDALHLTADGPGRQVVAEHREAEVDVSGGRLRVRTAGRVRERAVAEAIAEAPCPSGL